MSSFPTPTYHVKADATRRAQFTVFICVLFVLPTAHPTTALNMNYAVVAIGGVLLLVGACWAFWGRFHFSGPVKTVEESSSEKVIS